MKLSRIGEFGLIDRLQRQLPPAGAEVVVGPGDDAAAVRGPEGKLILLTADVLIEGIHFDRRIHGFEDIGWRAMAANISDIAAMGGRPGHALVSICLPDDVTVEQVEEIYRGMADLAGECGCGIIGGDTVSSPRELVVSVALTGEVAGERMVIRGGAREGDVIAVTGRLGGSQAGLAMLRSRRLETQDPGKEPPPAERWDRIRRRHLRPRPRLRTAGELVRSGCVHAMIDVSDGLAGDLRHLADRSGVGAEIDREKIPIDDQTRWAAEHLGASALDYALSGGEDFELLFTVAADTDPEILRRAAAEEDLTVALIGRVRPREEGLILSGSDGQKEPLIQEGFQHFTI
jgi:thiamine-monophosphate kinase